MAIGFLPTARALHLRRNLGGFRHAHAVAEARCRHLVVAKSHGRRSSARHDRALARAPSHGSNRTPRPGRCPKFSR